LAQSSHPRELTMKYYEKHTYKKVYMQLLIVALYIVENTGNTFLIHGRMAE
jgi:hypothetical protein